MNSTVFLHEKLKQKVKIVKNPYPSTALIPERLWRKVPIDCRRNFPRYLRRLQEKYSLLIQSQRYMGRNPLRTSFQEKGQNLVRHSYRPKEDNYQELRNMALAHGVSMNYIIVLMIHWEFLQIDERILSHIWRNRKPPTSKIIDIRRVLNLETGEVRIILIGWPRKFILERGSPSHWG
ncbi:MULTISPECIES: DUF1564 family protein [unclassified Leptospira]|uniref:DUF1564 family protein n=1 Tax=unclassified Leptospira TaxID=2633828 RepID=UPI0002BD50C3|nr:MULTISPECIES: DUF1564 family protein [unclassified Leptospira]EMJ99448.1 hypothetical protein LEP1GSC192_2909 [Leptospira sp. B5-022]MCR1792384.1 DUF1564 domain-containing protein [Leptospira sp. id769339]